MDRPPPRSSRPDTPFPSTPSFRSFVKSLGVVVVAAASSAEKAESARALGADQAFVYPAEVSDKASLTKLFKEQAGDRLFDVVCDPVGGLYGTAALRALAWGGRQLVLGFAAGLPEYAANIVLLKSADVEIGRASCRERVCQYG